MLPPLDSPSRLISIISEVTGASRSEVRQRLIAEAKDLGHNVAQEIKERAIEPFVMSEPLTKFYEDSDAFLYETSIWNACAAKIAMRQFITSRLQHLGLSQQQMLCFGDGLGFDSAYFGRENHHVCYFEPSIKCSQFAQSVFHDNQLDVNTLGSLNEIQPESLDVIVCLDVLEHIPSPHKVVESFRRWLRPGGLLFVNAPFWLIHHSRPTHLLENQKLSGDLKTMYQQNGFRALDSTLFWDPILLQKNSSEQSNGSNGSNGFGWLARARVKMGQALFFPAKWFNSIHIAVSRAITRPPKEFLALLQDAE